MMTSRSAARRPLPGSPFKTQPAREVEQFDVDDRVTHDAYGLGRVVAVEDATAVTVDFGSCRVRIPTPFDKLTKL